MNTQFRIVDGDLEVAHGRTGAILWRGKPDGSPVHKILIIEQSPEVVALLDYYHHSKGHLRALGNLIRARADGSIVWHAEVPETGDQYVDVEWGGEHLRASSWRGHTVEVDPRDGVIVSSRFTK